MWASSPTKMPDGMFANFCKCDGFAAGFRIQDLVVRDALCNDAQNQNVCMFYLRNDVGVVPDENVGGMLAKTYFFNLTSIFAGKMDNVSYRGHLLPEKFNLHFGKILKMFCVIFWLKCLRGKSACSSRRGDHYMLWVCAHPEKCIIYIAQKSFALAGRFARSDEKRKD